MNADGITRRVAKPLVFALSLLPLADGLTLAVKR